MIPKKKEKKLTPAQEQARIRLAKRLIEAGHGDSPIVRVVIDVYGEDKVMAAPSRVKRFGQELLEDLA